MPDEEWKMFFLEIIINIFLINDASHKPSSVFQNVNFYAD